MRLSMTTCAIALTAGTALSSPPGPGNTNSFVDAPRIFNDFPGTSLTFASDYGAGTVAIDETGYPGSSFANRHAAWFAGNNNGTKIDVDYFDSFTIRTTMSISQTGTVGNIEAGIQADLFGFGLFGVLTANGEIAAFGSTNPFYSFGTGLYNLGDEIMLEMIHTPGAGEFSGTPSTLEYRYNNLTTGSGWVSSGQIAYTNLEGGIITAFPQHYGVGAQFNNPGSDAVIGLRFWDTSMVPAPGTAALLGLGGLVAARRRR
ncbi:MAG: PEP-CTERM sorting domain-containing protein [Phycisphaerales bacterium JB040]